MPKKLNRLLITGASGALGSHCRKHVKDLANTMKKPLKFNSIKNLRENINKEIKGQVSKKIENRALDEKAPAGMTGREHVVRIVHQELVSALGEPRALKLEKQKIMV